MCLIRHTAIMAFNSWNNVVQERCISMVADIRFNTIRVFEGSRTIRNREKLTPIINLASLPNMQIIVSPYMCRISQAMLAKTGVHHYRGTNIELGTAC